MENSKPVAKALVLAIVADPISIYGTALAYAHTALPFFAEERSFFHQAKR